MKKTILMMASIALFTCDIMTSCSDNDKNEEKSPTLVGTWEDLENPFSKKGATDYFYTFYKDGTGAHVTFTYDEDGLLSKVSNKPFSWSAGEDKIMMIPQSDKPISSLGISYTYRLSGGTLELIDGSTSKRYKKVSESKITDIYQTMSASKKVCGLWTAKYYDPATEKSGKAPSKYDDVDVIYVEFFEDGSLKQYLVNYDQMGKLEKGVLFTGNWQIIGDKFTGKIDDEPFVFYYTFFSYNSFVNYASMTKITVTAEYLRVSDDDYAAVKADLEAIESEIKSESE